MNQQTQQPDIPKACKPWEGRQNDKPVSEELHEASFSCLCCKDSGIVSNGTIRKYYDPFYGSIHPDSKQVTYFDQNGENVFSALSEIAYSCNRCQASHVEILTDTGRKSVLRYSEGTVDQSLPEDVCERIHLQELKAFLEAATNSAKSAKNQKAQRQGLKMFKEIAEEVSAKREQGFSSLATALGVVATVDSSTLGGAAAVETAQEIVVEDDDIAF